VFLELTCFCHLPLAPKLRANTRGPPWCTERGLLSHMLSPTWL
jgi:hypothetical protein